MIQARRTGTNLVSPLVLSTSPVNVPAKANHSTTSPLSEGQVFNQQQEHCWRCGGRGLGVGDDPETQKIQSFLQDLQEGPASPPPGPQPPLPGALSVSKA